MLQNNNHKIVSDVLKDVAASFSEDRVFIKEIKDAIRERGFAILLIIFSLPLTVPLPIPPGATTIASIPLLLFSSQMIIGLNSPWLPKWIESKSIKRTALAMMVEKTSGPLKAIEKITSNRLTFVFSVIVPKLFAILVLICSISIAIPLPLTNFIPAISITLMSFAMLNKDGLMMIVGIIIGFIGIAITTAVIIFGPKMIMAILKHIF